MHVLTFTRLWPSSVEPGLAIFNEHRMRAVAALTGFSVHAVAPVPWYPRLPGPARYARTARVPEAEVRHGIPAVHPRYPVIPKIGLRLQGPALAAATLKSVEALVRRHAIDVIDAHYLYPDGWAAVEIARKLGLPVVVTACGSDVWRMPEIRGIRPFVEQTLAGATRLVAVSEPLAHGMRVLGADPAKLSVIPYGVDASRFAFDERGRSRVRERLGMREGETLIFTVGRLEHVKAHDVLIDAVARMSRSARVVIAGDGTLRASLERRIARRGVEDRVLLAGHVPNEELGAWLSAADLFTLPSRAEGHPNALIEALACGLPSVAAAVGAIPGMIDPANGQLVPAGDPGALARALDAGVLAVRHGRWARMPTASRSWRDVALETVAVFRAAIGRSRAPSIARSAT